MHDAENRKLATTNFRDNPISLFVEREAVLNGSFTAKRSPTFGCALSQFLKLELAEWNGGLQPILLKNSKFQ